RQERLGPHGTRVYLFDPISGRSYVLNSDRKVALRIPRVPAPPAPPAPPAASAFSAPPAPPVPPEPPLAAVAPLPPGTPALPAGGRPGAMEVTKHVIVRRNADVQSDDDGDADVRVQVLRVGRDAQGGIPQPLPPVTVPLLPPGRGETKSLGTREFGGVKAEGTQTTHTIAAGAIGNEKPIVIVSERWFSPELQLVVYAKTSDPRAGDTIYRLEKLQRGEPPADLFKIPEDYKRSPRQG
ncbi:MAG TPA: hypothetical protein VMV45_21345, partial [Casimicrobiaceae bacterium]|nr:hypothetical protein [Casimicrobiaceae bacterium]